MDRPQTFRAWSRYLSPVWLRRQWGAAFTLALGRLADSMTEAAQQAVLARYPSAVTYPPDALEQRGFSVGIPRLPGESAESYAETLRYPAGRWLEAGGGGALPYHFARLGLAAEIKDLDWGWYGTATPPADVSPEYWIVVRGGAGLDPDGLWESPGIYDDGGAWNFGLAAAVDLIGQLWSLVDQWGPLYYRCRWLIFAGAGWTEPDGVKDWTDPDNRSANAEYISR